MSTDKINFPVNNDKYIIINNFNAGHDKIKENIQRSLSIFAMPRKYVLTLLRQGL